MAFFWILIQTALAAVAVVALGWSLVDSVRRMSGRPPSIPTPLKIVDLLVIVGCLLWLFSR